MIPILANPNYQFSIPEHIRGLCDAHCPFWHWLKDDNGGDRPMCVADLDEAVKGGDLVPGPNCHPGTYRAERVS